MCTATTLEWTDISTNNSNGVTLVTMKMDEKGYMNLSAMEEIKSTFAHLAEDENTKVVVLAGQGPHYCRGVDFKDLFSQGIVVNHSKERYFLPTFAHYNML